MGTAIKRPVPDRVKPSFVIFALYLYQYGNTVGVKGLKLHQSSYSRQQE